MSARIRTGYSFRRAAGSLDDVIKRVKEIGLPAAPITDTTAFGWVRWRAICALHGLKPVFGAELAVKLAEGAKHKPVLDHWTFLAWESVVPLQQAISQATEQFHYEPQLTLAQAIAVPGVFTIFGHRTNPEDVPVAPRVFAGLSPACSAGWIRRAQASGHAFIACSANRYPSERQKSLYEVLAGKSAEVQSYPQHILSDAEWLGLMHGDPGLMHGALQTRDRILDLCRADLPQAHLPRPERTKSLGELCIEGARRLNIDIEEDRRYSLRLLHELDVIDEKGFADYFYIVADIVSYARSRMLVGPARGSSCGSLVCYLLGITTIDPIPFGLLFERFVDTSRDDLPDIDIDFSEQHRDLVFQYVRDRYGVDRVARLGTVNFYQTRSALNEACGALDLPPWTTEPIRALAEEHGVAKAFESDAGVKLLKDHPELAIAAEMEGHPRHAGQHAAGVVITQGAVTDIVAIDRKTGATMCDKLDAEKLNLLKIDALGLTQLSIFEHALQLAKLPRDHLFKVPLDDPKAFAVLNSYHFAGVFQFDGNAVQNISKAVPIESFDDIVTITALARPGPLNSGAARQWCQWRSKNEGEKTPLHDLLPETFGLIVYQEQVMRVCRDLADMDWANVNNLRRVISRTQGVEELAKFKELFVGGARKHMDDEQAEKLWSYIVTFGGYGFNKSHSVAYGVIAYWCCWLKAHHPAEYAAALLSHVGEDAQLAMLKEMEHEGLPFVPADPKLSTDKWTVAWINGQMQLLGPLTNIVGIGPVNCAHIIAQRFRGEEVTGAVGKALANCQFKIPNTHPLATRLAEVLPDPLARNIVSTPTPIEQIQVNGSAYEVMAIGVIDRIKQRNGGKLGLWIADDTDKIWCGVPTWCVKEITDRGRSGNAIYAVKGNVPHDFRCIWINDIKYIGDMENDGDAEKRTD